MKRNGEGIKKYPAAMTETPVENGRITCSVTDVGRKQVDENNFKFSFLKILMRCRTGVCS